MSNRNAPRGKAQHGESFPLEEIACQTQDGAAAFREQSSVLRTAALIRQMREAAQLSQRDLAKLIGTSQPYLSELERGTGAHGPSVLMLEKIATACDQLLRIEIGLPSLPVEAHAEHRQKAAACAA